MTASAAALNASTFVGHRLLHTVSVSTLDQGLPGGQLWGLPGGQPWTCTLEANLAAPLGGAVDQHARAARRR